MPKTNRCAPELWNAIRTAVESLDRRNIECRLVGSAALAALGFEIEAKDADFICEEEPAIGKRPHGGYGERTVYLGGWKIDHIYFNDGRLKHFFTVPALVDGVKVMQPVMVLELKRFANRPKDVEQLPAWRRLVEAA